MQTLVFTLLIFALAMLGLSLGVMFRRTPIRGSCGGLACQNACHACPKKKGGQA
ncbi:(Na+)-NQR maturation NqrM [Pseudogemmobacter bohemicus]|uniref:(Na+)-NQR maturation NqrM n=1 Tax=Pseudogemmobacter bohemicus TaxID=2250708 RepID=UPI000DD4B3BB|nr:(Na+)-NQR maturation NqrM [Pseudogemmobacter bohemicus]